MLLREKLPTTRSQLALVIFDIFLVSAALYTSLALRFEGEIPLLYRGNFESLVPVAAAVYFAFFLVFGLYQSLWRYASIDELVSITLAVTAATAAVWGCSWGLGLPLPRSVYIISWVLNIVVIGGIRFFFRLATARLLPPVNGRGGRRVLIVGGGDAGAMVIEELKKRRTAGRAVPVGVIDDDPHKQRQLIHGVPVLGRREDIPRIVREKGIEEVIISMPSVPSCQLRRIFDIVKDLPVRMKTVPGLYELIDGRIRFSRLREVQIEDLLRREPVDIDVDQVSGYLSGEVVLVTGAGGSIGSELCRQIARLEPARLLLFGHGEYSIYRIHRELVEKFPSLNVIPLIGDVQDRARVEQVFQEYRPRVVFHAAAHKHVPLMELNAGEAIKNNIYGTRNVAEVAHAYEARRFVLISTDKAVNPTSVMGATKRVAEMIIQMLGKKSNTKFCAVRFGNVLGSRGSVVPLFREQIAAGGPVTVTHPDMVRYFMTIPEAARLVIQAGALGKGGEVFLLDMGEPVRIMDLARDMIRLSGLEPERDVEIKIVGARPGEKLKEDLLTDEEGTKATPHERIYIARASSQTFAEFQEELRSLNEILGTDFTFFRKKMIQEMGAERA